MTGLPCSIPLRKLKNRSGIFPATWCKSPLWSKKAEHRFCVEKGIGEPYFLGNRGRREISTRKVWKVNIPEQDACPNPVWVYEFLRNQTSILSNHSKNYYALRWQSKTDFAAAPCRWGNRCHQGARIMCNYGANFIKSGDPNGQDGGARQCPSGPHTWKKILILCFCMRIRQNKRRKEANQPN